MGIWGDERKLDEPPHYYAIEEILEIEADEEDDWTLWDIPPSNAIDVRSSLHSNVLIIYRKRVSYTAWTCPLTLGASFILHFYGLTLSASNARSGTDQRRCKRQYKRSLLMVRACAKHIRLLTPRGKSLHVSSGCIQGLYSPGTVVRRRAPERPKRQRTITSLQTWVSDHSTLVDTAREDLHPAMPCGYESCM